MTFIFLTSQFNVVQSCYTHIPCNYKFINPYLFTFLRPPTSQQTIMLTLRASGHRLPLRPPSISTDDHANLPCLGSQAAIMFLASNICWVSSGTVRERYCWLPLDVRGAKPGMKKWRRGKGTWKTERKQREIFNWIWLLTNIVSLVWNFYLEQICKDTNRICNWFLRRMLLSPLQQEIRMQK